MSRLRRIFPALAFIAALLSALPALAEQKVTALFTAKATTGDSSIITFAGANTQDSGAIQVTWTGTAVVTLKATLDGTNWDTLATWSGSGGTDLASAKILTFPVLGGISYKLNQGTCSSCSTTAKATASGAAQILVY